MKEFFVSAADWILKLVASVGIADIVDILIVSFLIYYVIKLVRQTRAFQLVKGVVYMGVVYFIVSAFNMSASSFIFNQLFRNIVIVMILLFQPEIRHAIESIGRGDFRKFSIFNLRSSDFSTESYRTAASNISKAVGNMSDTKTGALIVIEGKTLLGEIISTGSEIDSTITVPMIENIFFPKAPLHDGAMVIRDNRIHSAGCILPLTQNDVSFELGTRHRAAIGMSEHSDALIVVVSEETGAISVAHNGTLERGITSGELYEIISAFLVSDEGEKSKVFRIRRRKK
ncbi:MAG: diadenylate cyclase CdaA [Clostridia bacterium]|nr:diadenylate cyclase CdaA [Clostridia bacterium]